MEEGNERSQNRPSGRRRIPKDKVIEKAESEGEQEELKEMPQPSNNSSTSRIRSRDQKDAEKQKPAVLKSAMRASDTSLRSEVRKSQTSLRSDEGNKQAVQIKESESIPASHFTVIVNGQIESCEFIGCDGLTCKFDVVYGDDWTVITGKEHGITQTAFKIKEMQSVVWNFPLEISFRSTNAFGWPQIALSVWGPDLLGNEVIRGYGATHLPTSSGRYVKFVRLFKPIATSWMQQVMGTLISSPTEFKDTKFIAKSEGRQVTRVTSEGIIKLEFSVTTMGMSKFGFSEKNSNGSSNNSTIY